MAERSASALWTVLNKRFSRLKYTIQPQAEANWIRLRFADFKTVGEYNSRLHRSCSLLQRCGTSTTDAYKVRKPIHKKRGKKGPNSSKPAKQRKAGKGEARP